MSTDERTLDQLYSPYYRGPLTHGDARDDVAYQGWLKDRARKMARRCILAVVIGVSLAATFMVLMINLYQSSGQ
jgi:hypothetical protein